MNEQRLNLLKKYWLIIIAVFFALAIVLGFVQRDNNQYTVNNQNTEIKLSEEAQNELWKYYNTANNLSGSRSAGKADTNPAVNKSTITFLAVGDIMLSRKVALAIKNADDSALPFSQMADILNPPAGGLDFNFANLESPTDGTNHFNAGETLVFNAPKNYLTYLQTYNFQILNLANNHALDQGLEGLSATEAILDGLGIKHIGTGNDLNAAWQPAVMDVNGIKICFLGASYASINDSGKTTNDYVARIEDLDRLKSTIVYLSAKGGSAFGGKSTCDFIVASMHAGTEYTRTPNRAQIDFAHAAIDYGADIVIGHHPHWVQTIEKYNGKYIFYSLGNFIFDQMWSQETREGLALKIKVSKIKNQNELQGPHTSASLDSMELIPIIIDNYSAPRPANEQEAKKILKKIGQSEMFIK